jgi:Family of unknown function (DUF6252)
MKNSYLFIVFLLVILVSCSKSSDYKPPVDNDELRATISINGAPSVSYVFKADQVSFILSGFPNGEKAIDIGCINNDNIVLRINFRNVTPPGTFNIGVNSGPEIIACEYSTGNSIIGFQNIHIADAGRGAGTVTIDSFTDTSISGTFNAKCVADGGSVVEITSGSFKGKF